MSTEIEGERRAVQASAGQKLVEVLVIDDDPAIARMVRLNLLAEGFRVRTAVHGEDGLHRVAESEPDVIILDLQMPIMDGRAFFVEARSRGCVAPVIILAATGAHRARAELGAEASIAKPFEPGELISAIRHVLRP